MNRPKTEEVTPQEWMDMIIQSIHQMREVNGLSWLNMAAELWGVRESMIQSREHMLKSAGGDKSYEQRIDLRVNLAVRMLSDLSEECYKKQLAEARVKLGLEEE